MNFMEKVQEILPEIDIQTGLMYCGDDEELFEEVVGEFIDGDMTETIEEYFQNKNWKDYQIQVHAVKGTSLTIGAEKLHEEATDIEQSVKNGDTDFAMQHHEVFMNHYKDVLEGLKKCTQ